MKIVIFGLSLSSSWGNGHATLWRGLCAALARRGHRVVFLERDTPYYAAHRDLERVDAVDLHVYQDWAEGERLGRMHLAEADVAVVTSYCPDGIEAAGLVCSSHVSRVFYDLDSPVTLAKVQAGEPVEYIGPRGLADFDLVLSYAGGPALGELQRLLGAQRVAPLYGSVDPHVHRPVQVPDSGLCTMSYMGTYAADRQHVLDQLFFEPARRRPDLGFRLAGAQYPGEVSWPPNMEFVGHLAPEQHPAFYCGSRMTLNVTRGVFARTGFGPSARLFEAAACGVPVLSDYWRGIEEFFEPGREILVAHTTEDVLAALDMPAEKLQRIGCQARMRVMCEHTAEHRAVEFEELVALPRAASLGMCLEAR